MRKTIILFLAFGLFTSVLSSCKKEEKNVTNMWKCVSYTVNGQPQSLLTGDNLLDIKDDNTYVATPSGFGSILDIGPSGTWSFSSDYGSITFVSTASWGTDTYKILKLEKSKFEIEIVDSYTFEFHFEPQ
jgi:hypothetical protein